MLFKGLCTALITPFDGEKVDFESFSRLVEYQISGGVDALLFLGTTGEPSTMSGKEKEDVMRFAVETVAGRVPVVIGAGANCTADSVENAKKAQNIGADSLLVVTPYYNKCTQSGIYEHYKAVCEAVDIPVISYNVPGRTCVNILPDTAARISELKNMAAIKEASGNMTQIAETARLIDGKMKLYSGDDGLAVPIFSVGAEGLVSVVSNVAPALTAEMTHSWFSGDIEKAKRLSFELAPLISALFSEVSPIPAKYACSRLGICKNELRLPLTRAAETTQAKIDKLLAELEITL